MSKPIKRILIAIVVLLILFIILYPKLFPKKDKNPSPTSGAKPNANRPIPVQAIILKTANLDNKILATGTLLANEEVDIRSEISGKITKILFQEGTYVAKGTPLIRINDVEYQAQLRKLLNDKKLIETQEDRQKKLLAKEAISQQEYDVTNTQLIGTQADIEILQAQIDKSVIRAPFDGIIGLRHVSEGAYISPTISIATMTSINPIKIEFSVPSKYSNYIQKGKEIYFTVENNTEKHKGIIYATESKIDLATRTLFVRANAPNSQGKLLAGSFVKIEVILASLGESLVVPTEAIIPELNGHKVYLVKNKKAVSQKVEIGERTESHVQILKGLQAGDTIATSGVLQLKPDAPVNVTIKTN